MPERRVEFYFDYLSPYAYLASLRLPELCRERGVALELHPVLFAGLLDHWGQLGPAEILPKALHTFRDVARRAARLGVPLRAPHHHPFRPLEALRVSLREVSGADQLTVVRAIFDAGWARGEEIGEAPALERILAGAGLDGAALIARTREPAIKRRLSEETERAIGHGVFGVPTMRCDGELLWGFDQVDTLAEVLDGVDPLAGVTLEERGPDSAAAHRRRSPRRPGA